MSKAIVLLGDLGTDHQGFPPTPVTAGSPTVLVDGKPVARVGDPLAPHSKPKHPPHPRAIAAGSATVMIDGMPAAVTGGAVSCGGVTIGSGSVVIGDTHTPASFSGISSAPGRAVTKASTAASSVQFTPTSKTEAGMAEPALPSMSNFSPSALAAAAASSTTKPETDENEELSEPGFHIVRRPMTRNELLGHLYGDASAKPGNFDRLNPELGSRTLPGEMIVIADPNSLECTTQENELMSVAAQVNQEVRQLNEKEAQFITDHYDLLELMTANAATGLGVGATMIAQQIKSINGILKELEALYQSTFRKNGKLSHPDFFERRQKLFAKLDFALGSVARKGLSLDDNAKLKRALGLSSKSIVHEWKSSGVGGIPGYATHYPKLAAAAKYAQGAGYIAIGLDYYLMDRRLERVCTFGVEEECEVAKYKEYGRLSGSVAGGAAGAAIAVAGCGLIGVSTAGIGAVACAIIAGGTGSATGGYIGGAAGEGGGDLIRRVVIEND